DRRPPGAPQFSRLMEAGLLREGEAFASGGAAANLPRCILTGGAASMTVSYQGKSYPVCCTGCRDEFNDNPEKYIKLAALKATTTAPAPGDAVPAVETRPRETTVSPKADRVPRAAPVP